MKIDAFYFNDLSDYDDILEYLCSSIENKFYGIGKNSISITKFVDYLKQVLKTYVRLKYNKNINIVMTLQRFDGKLVSNNSVETTQIKIRLSNEKINNILEGKYPAYEEYLQELLDQLDTELTSQNRFNFNNYLNIQINGLTNIALSELRSSFTEEYLKKNIVDKTIWIKFAEKSSVFNDYYRAYIENSDNKKLFYSFLKQLIKEMG